MAEIRINATGGVKLYDADDSHYAQIIAGTITANVDLLTLNSAGITVLDGAIDFDIASHDTSNGLKLGGTLVTATAAELNIMDGVTSTAAEINLIDGGTSRGTTAIADGDGVLINDAGTMRMTTVQTLATYIGGSDPSSADGDTLGTASLEWSDLYLADSSVIYFGNDQDVTLTHDPDDGLFLKSIATADNNPVLLTLQTGETDLAADDVIGKIAFQAPDEGTGTDAILVSAAIQAVAEGDHSSSSNATSLQFMTGASEAATEKMRIEAGGDVGIGITDPYAKIHVSGQGGSGWVSEIRNTTSSGTGNISTFYHSAQTPDNNTSKVINYQGYDDVIKFIVYSDGDVQNHDNSYGGISDERIKQDIKDANSQWDDIKALRVRNFKKKDDVRKYAENAWEQIGVVAQELEASGMDKIVKNNEPSASDVLSDSSFGTLYEEGDVLPEYKKVGDIKTTTSEKVKSVKYSIIYMKAIKALQEAQTRIETLEAKVAVLEG